MPLWQCQQRLNNVGIIKVYSRTVVFVSDDVPIECVYLQIITNHNQVNHITPTDLSYIISQIIFSTTDHSWWLFVIHFWKFQLNQKIIDGLITGIKLFSCTRASIISSPFTVVCIPCCLVELLFVTITTSYHRNFPYLWRVFPLQGPRSNLSSGDIIIFYPKIPCSGVVFFNSTGALGVEPAGLLSHVEQV